MCCGAVVTQQQLRDGTARACCEGRQTLWRAVRADGAGVCWQLLVPACDVLCSSTAVAEGRQERFGNFGKPAAIGGGGIAGYLCLMEPGLVLLAQRGPWLLGIGGSGCIVALHPVEYVVASGPFDYA